MFIVSPYWVPESFLLSVCYLTRVLFNLFSRLSFSFFCFHLRRYTFQVFFFMFCFLGLVPESFLLSVYYLTRVCFPRILEFFSSRGFLIGTFEGLFSPSWRFTNVYFWDVFDSLLSTEFRVFFLLSCFSFFWLIPLRDFSPLVRFYECFLTYFLPKVLVLLSVNSEDYFWTRFSLARSI